MFPTVRVHFSTPMRSDQLVDRVGQQLSAPLAARAHQHDCLACAARSTEHVLGGRLEQAPVGRSGRDGDIGAAGGPLALTRRITPPPLRWSRSCTDVRTQACNKGTETT